jgi:hypothetical protein
MHDRRLFNSPHLCLDFPQIFLATMFGGKTCLQLFSCVTKLKFAGWDGWMDNRWGGGGGLK